MRRPAAEKMRFVHCCILLINWALLSSCSNVVSKNPVGLEPYSIHKEDWNGTWLNDNEVITIRVKDEASGVIQLAWIERRQDELKYETMTCQLMKGRKWQYVNVLEIPNEDATGFYFWAKIKKEEREIIVWLPSLEAFQNAVEKKQIEGVVEKTIPHGRDQKFADSVKLFAAPQAIVDEVEKKDSQFFIWEDPVVLIKMNN